MRNVEVEALSIDTLLRDKKYTLDYFQREYEWGKSDIVDLIDDLFEGFQQYLQNSQIDGENTHLYFLGNIIISEVDGKLSLIDGQQRITSILLILIWIAQRHKEIKKKILPLIFKENEKGQRVCTLHVKERDEIMIALYDEGTFDTRDKPHRIKNIGERFRDINIHLKNIKFEEIDAFVDWLTESVRIAEIKTIAEKDGYNIFETANDRGVKLSYADMLKSYLLSNIESDDEKDRLNNQWKKRISEIKNPKDIENAIRCWLRAGHVENITDIKEIGDKFHRWVKDKIKEDYLPLKSSQDFSQFIEENFEFYTRWYLQLQKIAKNYDIKHEAIHWNYICNWTTLQYDAILSALSPNDEESDIWKKINVVATFIDILIARSMWNRAKFGRSTMDSKMQDIMLNIKGKDLKYVLNFLLSKLNEANFDEVFYASDKECITINGNKNIHNILARFSIWLDREYDDKNKSLLHYLKNNKNPYSIEHIIPNKFEDHYSNIDEFESEHEFNYYRGALGALLLLRKSLNESLQDMPYEKKLIHYYGKGPLLAKTLHKSLHKNDTDFARINNFGFEPHDKFLRREVLERQKVYARLAQKIWSVERLTTESEIQNYIV